MKGHTTTETRYPKGQPCPSDAWFTRQGKDLSGGNRTKTEYPGDSTTPNGGHHSGTDKVRVTQAEGASGGPSKDSYPISHHKPFKNEKVG